MFKSFFNPKRFKGTCICGALGYERTIYIDFMHPMGDRTRELVRVIQCNVCEKEHKHLVKYAVSEASHVGEIL